VLYQGFCSEVACWLLVKINFLRVHLLLLLLLLVVGVLLFQDLVNFFRGLVNGAVTGVEQGLNHGCEFENLRLF